MVYGLRYDMLSHRMLCYGLPLLVIHCMGFAFICYATLWAMACGAHVFQTLLAGLGFPEVQPPDFRVCGAPQEGRGRGPCKGPAYDQIFYCKCLVHACTQEGEGERSEEEEDV